MSSIDERYEQSAKDYGRKSYRADDKDDFITFMSKKTVFMYNAVFAQSWSEFEKPYFEDDYTEMEQNLWNPPGLPWNPYDWDLPGFPSDPQDPGDDPFGYPSLTVFWCGVSGCWCPEDTKDVALNCSHPVIGVAISAVGPPSGDFSISGTGPVKVTASKNAAGAVEIDVTMQADSGVVGTHESIMITECSDCESCEEAEEFAWDSELTPETVGGYDYVSVYVTGGVGPYTWELSGDSNATLLAAKTQSPQNTIRTNGACGGLNITVTDFCGNQVEGGIRVTSGRWTSCCHFSYIVSTCRPDESWSYYGPSPIMYSAVQRLYIECAYLHCYDPGYSQGCVLGPCSCEDTKGQTYSFECFESGCSVGWSPTNNTLWSYEYWRC